MTKNEKYYVGFDMGTSSLGAAVTDVEYNPLKFHGKTMMVSRTFDESKAADKTRLFRCQRRRIQRSHQRVELLNSLFSEEICKIDKNFLPRLTESFYQIDDRTDKQPNALFNDKDFTDKDYHKAYPTIYHLRKALIEGGKAFDIRLLYLAIHHIVKNRGHFLFESVSDSGTADINDVCNELFELYNSMFLGADDEPLICPDVYELGEIIKSKQYGMSAKESRLLELCGVSKKEKSKAALLGLCAGCKKNLADIFGSEYFEDIESKLTLKEDMEAVTQRLESVLGDGFELILRAKALFDWGLLAEILDNKAKEPYISYSMVEKYEDHKADLKKLKECIRRVAPYKYDECFKAADKPGNYASYVGMTMVKGKKIPVGKNNSTKCTQEDFYKYIKAILEKSEDKQAQEIIAQINSQTFMRKQVMKDNGVIPYQVHQRELVRILENAVEYLPFLAKKDERGLTTSDKIIALFKFRIPYYVGPLNKKSDRSWIVRSDEKIYPWNFNDIVDTDKSAEQFIERMTNYCTYIKSEKVLPKSSLLYSEFTLLNELNNLRINGEKLDVPLKKEIVDKLFKNKRYKNVREKNLHDFLKSVNRDGEISGIDGDFKNKLTSYQIFENMLEKYKDSQMIEEIIRAITIFGDDRKQLRKRLEKQYGKVVSPEDLDYCARQKFKDWGRFSEKLLTEIYHVDDNGEAFNIIDMMRNTNENFMQLMSKNYQFYDKVQEYNAQFSQTKSIQDMIDDLYVSPLVKRPIMQTINMLDEIVKIKGCAPAKIFMEFPRTNQAAKKRTVSRKTQLQELYKSCKKDYADLFDELDNYGDDDLKRDKLYLYFTQLGRCMYSDERIDINDLNKKDSTGHDVYDIDHIYPQSKIKDDSLSNRVLVKHTINGNKNNTYPVSAKIRSKCAPLWKILKDKGLISQEKYKRLTRSEDFTDSELEGFVNRQLVVTRQSTKAVTELFSQLYPDTKLVYVKAENVSRFRQDNGFDKCRAVNDLHHAKDAYLNIVVGNVYDVRCTSNPANFIKGLRSGSYSMNKMFDYPVENAWVIKDNESLNTVKAVMAKNNIQNTRLSFEKHEKLFDVQILKKNDKSTGSIGIKSSNPILSQKGKYGYYGNTGVTYFCLCEYTKKNKSVRSIEAITSCGKLEYEKNPQEYITKVFGYESPNVLIKKIRVQSIFEYNGFRMMLTGKTNDRLLFGFATQLILSAEDERYIKQISKFIEKSKTDRNVIDAEKFTIITREENMKLYDTLLHKIESTIFKETPQNYFDKLKNGRVAFINLSLFNQCYVLSQILAGMHCNTSTCDLSLINGIKGDFGLRVSKNYYPSKTIKSFKLIYQSVTGLFEQEVDLLCEDSKDMKPKKRR